MLKAERIDAVVKASELGDHEGWQQRMKAWHRLSPSEANPCPYYVLGRQCREYTKARHCLCQSDSINGIFDHRAVWRDEDGGRVFTGEPYGMSQFHLEGLDHVRIWAEEHGLVVQLSALSPWYPLSTVLIKIRKPDRHGF